MGQPIVDIIATESPNRVVLLLRSLIVVLDLFTGKEVSKIFLKRPETWNKFLQEFVVAASDCFVVANGQSLVGHGEKGNVLWTVTPPGRPWPGSQYDPQDDDEPFEAVCWRRFA